MLSSGTRVLWYDYISTIVNGTMDGPYFNMSGILFRIFGHFDGALDCVELWLQGYGGSYNFAFLQVAHCNESRHYACIRQIPKVEVEGKNCAKKKITSAMKKIYFYNFWHYCDNHSVKIFGS